MLFQFLAHAENITRPMFLGFGGVIEREFYVGMCFLVKRQETYLAGSVAVYFNGYAFVNGTRKDEPAVIVGVFAYQVYASRRKV